MKAPRGYEPPGLWDPPNEEGFTVDDSRTSQEGEWALKLQDAQERSAVLFRKAQKQLSGFIANRDRALQLTQRPDGGVSFPCPECGDQAAAVLRGPYFSIEHTLKSGTLYQGGGYGGSCALSMDSYGSSEIRISLLPENPPAITYPEPQRLDGALSFDEDESDREWLIEPLIARGDYISIFGPSEVGKSLLMQDWALRMAHKDIRVLYLDRENPKAAIKSRLRAMGAESVPDALTILPFVEIADLATVQGSGALSDMVRRSHAQVLVLDTISKFSSVGQASASDRWNAIYSVSLVPLLSEGVTVIQLDHTGHANKDRERDSSAKRDNVSVAYGLTSTGPDTLMLTRAKNRVAYPGDRAINLHRVSSPVLTHTTGEPIDVSILNALRELEKADVPIEAGRDVARALLKASGVSMSNDLLAKVIRLRRASEGDS